MPEDEAADGRTWAVQRAAASMGRDADEHFVNALLTAAAEAVMASPDFARRVRARLEPISTRPLAAPAMRPPAQPPTTLAARSHPRLVPMRRIPDAELDPFAPPNPHYLLRLYGAEQLPAALAEYSFASLRLAAWHLFDDESRPRLPRSKAAMIAFIVARVTAGK